MSGPPLSEPGRCAWLSEWSVHPNVDSRSPQALVQVREQPRFRGFALATLPSCCRPHQHEATEVAVVLSTRPRLVHRG
jgi:hypothetical protein